MLRVATDIGGTFTDLVYVAANGTIASAKSHTTPAAFEQGVMDVITAQGIPPEQFASFVHGTTVVINAITERKGAVVGLITTSGFRDVIEIGRGNRPDFFNLEYRKPVPFVPRHLRREIPGRMSYTGTETLPLDLSGLPGILDDFRRAGVASIAVALINAYANPAHEHAVVARMRALWPAVTVVASTDITREWREYERSNTAVLCAYVQPIASQYLDRLTGSLARAAMPCTPYIMQSNCGVDTIANARHVPITMIESGPASGVWAAAALGRIIGEDNVISIDIGGTTAKCSLIDAGQVKLSSSYFVERSETSAGYPVLIPVVDLVEIGSGGGSVAWVDEFSRMHVGPRSAGAVPGPVAYGLGGTDVTTTDANLALGCMNPEYFCGGSMVADMAGVEKALARLATTLGLSTQETARGIVRIANNDMVNAIKLVSVNRGHDPRDFTLVAFGGGGGLHACVLAKELGIRKIVIPRQAAVFSAWGMLLTDLRRDYLHTRLVDLTEPAAAERISDSFAELERRACAEYEAEHILPSRMRFERYARVRYQNQEHSVEIDLPFGTIDAEQLGAVVEHFHATFEREYTYRLTAPVELVGFHLIAYATVDKARPVRPPRTGRMVESAVKDRRPVDYLEAGIHRSTIYDGAALEPDMAFQGPAIVEEPGTTTVIPPGVTGRVDEYGNLCIERAS